MRRVLARPSLRGDGGPRGRRRAFSSRFTLPPRALAPRRAASADDRARRLSRPLHRDPTARARVDEIAAAAARAGLQFVILTDHGDAHAPARSAGVSARRALHRRRRDQHVGGHVVALGLRQASPYPLAGEARDVIEDIQRLGGRAVARASRLAEGRRCDGAAPNVPFDGIEWVNADSEWRDDSPWRLLAVCRAVAGPAGRTIASLFTRPARTLQRWDTALRRAVRCSAWRRSTRTPTSRGRESEEPRRARRCARPTYEAMFRTLSQAVVLDRRSPATRRPTRARVWRAHRRRPDRSRSSRAIAGPGRAELRGATRRGTSSPMGGDRSTSGRGAGRPRRASPAPTPRASCSCANGSRSRAGGGASTHRHRPRRAPIASRRTTRAATFPWLVSNAIRVRRDGLTRPGRGGASVAASPTRTRLARPETARHVEHDPASTGVVRPGRTTACASRFSSAPARRAGQYAAIDERPGDRRRDRAHRVHGARQRPMRLSVQVRLPATRTTRAGGARSTSTRRRGRSRCRCAISSPSRPRPRSRPIVARLHAVLVVVDTVNTLPGTDGTSG